MGKSKITQQGMLESLRMALIQGTIVGSSDPTPPTTIDRKGKSKRMTNRQTSDKDDDDDSYEDESRYESDEDGDDEGTYVGMDRYDSQEKMEVEEKKVEANGGEFQQPMEELLAPIDDGALLIDDVTLSIDDGALLTDPPTEKAQDKPTDSSMNEFGNLPTLGSLPGNEILRQLLDRAKTLDEDVKEMKTMLYSAIKSLKQDIGVMFGNTGNVFNTTIASWEERFAKDLIHNYRMMDDRVGGVEKNIAEHGADIQRAFTQMRMKKKSGTNLVHISTVSKVGAQIGRMTLSKKIISEVSGKCGGRISNVIGLDRRTYPNSFMVMDLKWLFSKMSMYHTKLVIDVGVGFSLGLFLNGWSSTARGDCDAVTPHFGGEALFGRALGPTRKESFEPHPLIDLERQSRKDEESLIDVVFKGGEPDRGRTRRKACAMCPSAKDEDGGDERGVVFAKDEDSGDDEDGGDERGVVFAKDEDGGGRRRRARCAVWCLRRMRTAETMRMCCHDTHVQFLGVNTERLDLNINYKLEVIYSPVSWIFDEKCCTLWDFAWAMREGCSGTVWTPVDHRRSSTTGPRHDAAPNTHLSSPARPFFPLVHRFHSPENMCQIVGGWNLEKLISLVAIKGGPRCESNL
ncbi:hypothetical protein Sjap_002046 [Stephania japonica]|uniref:Uncharacterized protein n=1 Tax=Stephania japonica TaxID=461633 RepID=A0AAP0KL31_9MAGN